MHANAGHPGYDKAVADHSDSEWDLVIASGDVADGSSYPLLMMGILVALVLIMGLIDMLVFTNLDEISKYLDPHRLAVTEAVFGVLLSALAIQLMLNGLAELGIIDMLAH